MRHLAALISALLVLPGCAVVNRASGMSQARELQAKGVPAMATIVRIWDTGMTVNDDPVVGFELDVRPAEGAGWAARTKQRISRLDVPRIQPGAVVAVRYDPSDRARVSLALAE